MTCFEPERHAEFDGHSNISFVRDEAAGMCAIIAIHRDSGMFAAGGIRMQPYSDTSEALGDVLRLSRAMTYKLAAAELPVGGAKSVIIGDPIRDKTPELLAAFARKVNQFAGGYRCGGDVGIGNADIEELSKTCKYTPRRELGDIAVPTAEGVFHAIRAGVASRLKTNSLEGIRVSIQGAGAVGGKLAKMLASAGCELVLSDIDQERCQEVANKTGARIVPVGESISIECDVFSPCALGGVLNAQSIPSISARVICGAANNQLAGTGTAALLNSKNILYVPDFVANAGGVISGLSQECGYTAQESANRIIEIYDRVLHLSAIATESGCSTERAALLMAQAYLDSYQ